MENSKRWEFQTTLPVPWGSSMQDKKLQLELDREEWTSSKLGKEYIKAVCCHPVPYRAHHTKCWAGWITSWNQDCPEKYQQPQPCRWYHPNGRKRRGTKEPLDEGKTVKAGLKLNIENTKTMASGPIISWKIDRETIETDRLYFLGLQNHWRWWLQPWN